MQEQEQASNDTIRSLQSDLWDAMKEGNVSVYALWHVWQGELNRVAHLVIHKDQDEDLRNMECERDPHYRGNHPRIEGFLVQRGKINEAGRELNPYGYGPLLEGKGDAPYEDTCGDQVGSTECLSDATVQSILESDYLETVTLGDRDRIGCYDVERYFDPEHGILSEGGLKGYLMILTPKNSMGLTQFLIEESERRYGTIDNTGWVDLAMLEAISETLAPNLYERLRDYVASELHQLRCMEMHRVDALLSMRKQRGGYWTPSNSRY